METRIYQVGGLCVRMDGCLFREGALLAPFRVSSEAGTVLRYSVQRVPSLCLPSSAVIREHEAEAVQDGQSVRYLLRDGSDAPLLCETVHEDVHEVCIADAALSLWDTNLVMKLWRLPERLLNMGELFLHASMIEYHGEAILFTGHKQIGKSTQAGLWEQCRGAKVINGDRALLRKLDGKWYACGSPYCGTSKISKNGSFPLRAVVLLSQAKENRVSRATAKETVAAFLDGCTFDVRNAAQTVLIMDSAADIFAKTAVLKLACLPDAGAVACLEEFISAEAR